MAHNPFRTGDDDPFKGSNSGASEMNEVDLGNTGEADNPYAAGNGTAYEYPVTVATTGAYQSAPPAVGGAYPGVSANGSNMPTGASVSAREKDLAKREAALAAREQALRTREETARSSGGGGGMGSRGASGGGAAGYGRAGGPNWPMCSPVIYHNIREEIPAGWQGAVTKAYWSYLALICCLIWNFASLTVFSFGAGGDMGGFFMAAIYMVTAIPGALWLWYLRLYNASIRNRSFTFGWFFLVYFLHVAFCFWAAIAPPLGPSSFTGAFSTISAFNKGVVYGVMYIIGCIFWGLEALWSLLVLQQTYAQFRAGGGQAALQAQASAASHAASAAMSYSTATSGRV